MHTGFIDTPEDCQWLRDTALRGVPLPATYAEFASAVLQGNEDAPHAVNLYANTHPEHTDDFYRVTFDHEAPTYCECIEFDGRTNEPKRSTVTEAERADATRAHATAASVHALLATPTGCVGDGPGDTAF